MKKTLLMIALGAVAILASRSITLSQYGPLSQFTATFQIDRFNEETGSLYDSHEEIIAIRPNGAIAQLQKFTNGINPDTHVIYDPTTLNRIVIDKATRSKGTFGSPSPKLPATARRTPLPETCKPDEDSKTKEFAGYAAHSFTKCTDGCDTETTEWKSPRLGCLTIAVETKRNGVKIYDRRIVSVDTGPPDPALFNVPDEYAERSPREYATERARVLGESPPDDIVNAAQGRYLGGKRNAQ